VNDSLNLLLVEDSEDDAFFFQRTVTKSGVGCSVHHVVDGLAAVKYLSEAQAGGWELPDLMFLDLKMPRMNGFEVLQWVRTRCFSNPVPVIVLSGSFEIKDQDRAKELGATEYLVKPIRAEVFRSNIERWLAVAKMHRLELKENGLSC